MSSNKTYALISNGTVVNIIVAAPDFDPALLLGGTIENAVEIQQIQIGWGWNSTTGFTAPPSDKAKEEAIRVAEAQVLSRALAASNLAPTILQQINAKLGVR